MKNLMYGVRPCFIALAIYASIQSAFADASCSISISGLPSTTAGAVYGQTYNITVSFTYSWANTWLDDVNPSGGAYVTLYEEDYGVGTSDQYGYKTLSAPANGGNASGTWTTNVTFTGVRLADDSGIENDDIIEIRARVEIEEPSINGKFDTTEYFRNRVPAQPSSISVPSTDSDGSYTVSWGSSTGASGFELQEKQGSGGSWSSVYTGTGTSKDLTGRAAGYTYYYQVRGYNNVASGAWRTDTTGCTVPHTVNTPNTPTGPSSGSTGSSLSFSTGGSSCNQGHSVQYRFDWGDGNTSAWGASSQSKSYSSGGNYTVKAQARCATVTTVLSSWSGGLSVSITAPPSKATSPNPGTGSTSISIEPTLSWANGGGATSYDVWFGTSAGGMTKVSSAQGGTSYTPSRRNTGTTYYWRIDTRNSAGTTQGDTWTFTTCGNATSASVRGTTSGQEYGDALYRYLSVLWGVGNLNYNHAGLFSGLDSSGTYRTFESFGGSGDSTGEGSFTTSFSNYEGDSSKYYGAFISVDYSTTMPFSTRRAIVGRAKEVADAAISYPSLAVNALEYGGTSFDGTVADITAIRCDGVVEYSYEKEGVRVWRNCLRPDSEWSIVTNPDAHNNMPDASTNPEYELSPWAQRGSTTSSTTGPGYSGPPWPDTRLTKSAPVNLPTMQLAVLEATTTYADVRISATDESGIFQITHTKPDGDGPQQYKKNPDRHPTSDTYTPATIRLVRLAGNNSYNFGAAAQDHGGNWGNTYRWDVVFMPYKATSPSPANGATGRSVSISLSWQDGGGATSYDVYWGTSPASLSKVSTQTSPSYSPSMNYSTTYYWRIDSKNSTGTTTGDVWSFTTASAPSPGSVQFSASAYSVNENGGTLTITATRTGGSYGAASVNYATANGSATAGADYTSKSGSLNWSDGDAGNKTFTVSITDDAAFEGDETFTVSLSGASGASLGSPSSATVSIIDNDTPARGTVQFSSATFSVAENGGSITLNATRQGGSYGAASVNYATANGTASAGSDYTARSGTLNWTDGDTATKTLSVPILDDSTYEGNETFTVTLSGVVGASLGSPSTTTVTIQENEVQPDTQQPTIQITAPTTSTTYTSPTNRLNIGGTASDNVGVTSVKARNFRDVGEYTCTGTTSWQYNGLPLFQGLNNISVIAYDAAGNSQTDTVAVTYSGDTQYDDVLRSGGIVQEINFPDNLTPGSTVTVRWKILSYVPVVARVYGGIPGGWYFYKNGTYTGYAESPWNLSGRHAGVYSFECSWPVPQKSGDFDVWFNMAQMDCDQFMIPVIPDGVDSRPDPTYAKLIQRTILPGGNGTDPTSDPDTWSNATVFETVDQHKKRSAAAVTYVSLADNLAQGAQVTCEWKILSYVPVKAQLLMLNLTQQQVWLTANATQVGSPVQTTYNFQDRTTGTRYYASEYTFRTTFTVPNQPGTQQIFFRCQESANSSSSWMGANLSADIDPRPAQYNGMYGRFIERTINP